VIDVAVLAADPVLTDAATTSNRSYQGLTEEAAAARIQKIDSIWNSPAAEPLVKEMLSSRASRALRRYLDLDPRFLRITVTDARGATIAASHKTSDFFQADEDYWRNIYAGGKGAVSLTDILHDEVTQADYIGVGVPIVEEGSNEFIGTVDALVNVSSLAPIVNRPSAGSHRRVLLVKEDGTVICGPQITFAMNVKSGEFAAVEDAKSSVPLTGGSLGAQSSGYVVAEVQGAGRQVIGFADTGLRQDYRSLGWTALAAENAREAFAPVRFVDRLLLLVSLLGLLMVAVLVMYFAVHRQLAYVDIGTAAKSRPPAGGEPPQEKP